MYSKSILYFTLKLILINLLLLSALRITFISIYINSPVTIALLVKTLGIGIFFDITIISIGIFLILMIAWIIQATFKKYGTAVLKTSSTILVLILSIVNFLDIYFFKYYGVRLNSLAFNFFTDFSVIAKMIWKMFPVHWVLLGFIIITILVSKLINYCAINLRENGIKSYKYLFYSLLICSILSFQFIGPPFWYISSFSNLPVLNQGSMNGVYTLIKSFQQELIYKKDLLDFERGKEKQYNKALQSLVVKSNEISVKSNIPTLRESLIVKKDSNKNLVIIICESFAAHRIGCLSKIQPSPTPRFDSLSKNGLFLTNCFANGPRTQYALVNILGGFPAVLSQNPIRRKGINEFHSIANVVKKNNYNTFFMTAGDAGYDDMDMYLTQGGFDEIIDKDNFSKYRFKNEWGICDEDLFDSGYQKIIATKQPFLATLLTISNHSPWDIPSYFLKEHPEVQNFSIRDALYYYSDYAISRFIHKMQSWDGYKNTIFMIVADHGEAIDAQDGQFKIFHVPVLILNSQLENKEFNKICAQCDLAPTLVNLMNIRGTYHFMGQNIFDENFIPFAVSRHYSPTLFYITDSIVLMENVLSNTAITFKMNEQNYLLPTDCNKSLQENLIKKLNLYTESASYIYQTNKYRCE